MDRKHKKAILTKLKQIARNQDIGYCAKTTCVYPRDTGMSLCRACWLALPAEYRRDIVRAQNAYQATRNEDNRDRFRAAWWRAVECINAPAKADEAVSPAP